MKISIITPCYNAEKYIASMIASVLAQSYSNFELIIVNDGSKDKSTSIISTFNDDRIKLINQKNSGKPSIPRNNGIKQATGDIICFLDSDDTYYPTKLEKIVSAFKQHPGTDYLFHDHVTCLENLTPIVESYTHASVNKTQFGKLFSPLNENLYQVKQTLYKFSLFKTPLIHTNAIAINVKSYPKEKITFREDVVCTEDLILWNYLITNGVGVYLDEPLSTYRDSINSVTDNKAQFDLDTYKFYKENMTNYHSYLNNDDIAELKLRATDDIMSASYSLFKDNPKLAKALAYEALKFNVSLSTVLLFIKTQLKSFYSRATQ